MSVPSINSNNYQQELNQAIKEGSPKEVEKILKKAREILSPTEQRNLLNSAPTKIDEIPLIALYGNKKFVQENPEKVGKIARFLLKYKADVNLLIDGKPLLTVLIEKLLKNAGPDTLIPVLDLILAGTDIKQLSEQKQTTLEYLSSEDFSKKFSAVNPYHVNAIKAFLTVYGNVTSDKESKPEINDQEILKAFQKGCKKEATFEDYCQMIQLLKSKSEEANDDREEFIDDLDDEKYKHPQANVSVNLSTYLELEKINSTTTLSMEDRQAIATASKILSAYGATLPTLQHLQEIMIK